MLLLMTEQPKSRPESTIRAIFSQGKMGEDKPYEETHIPDYDGCPGDYAGRDEIR